MSRAVVLSAVRTPIGRYGGTLSGVRPDDLAALVIREAVARAGVPAENIEDVWFGAANQAGEDNRNVARMASLLAGLPEAVAGVTVNRLCASGLAAVVGACHAVIAGDGDLFVAGGEESMSRAPFVTPKAEKPFERSDRPLYDTTLGWRFTNPKLEELFPPESMGETGENVAEKYGVSREEQDRFALQSHQRAVAAQREGRFAEQIVPVEVPPRSRREEARALDADEGPREDTSMEKLAKLRPAFREGGTVTAGNSSTLNDGAACLVLGTEEAANELGKEPLARIVSIGVAGVDPAYMGIGPMVAIPKALERAGLELDQIDLIELNEAFASQVLACAEGLGIEEERLNVNGGAIALGHPLGCSGARLMTNLAWELRNRGARYGIATLCVGVGQGVATVVEAL
jgi:3-oxoadipyl-CoA thiolase